MAHATYDMRWEEAMADLNEALHSEDHTLGLKEGETAPAAPQPSLQEAVQHWSCLYLRYLGIFRTLEQCYDDMVHPQKRIDVKLVMELVMTRVLELKQLLVKWNPPHPTLVTPGAENPFPWEYVNFDDVLVDLKLPPKALEVPIPRYFLEECADNQAARDNLVDAIKANKLGEDFSLLLEEGREEQERRRPLLEFTIEEAIQCLQRCERGRQAIGRANQTANPGSDDNNRKMLQKVPDSYTLDPEIAASNIQRLFRGNQSRTRAIRDRDRELAFIGMRMANEWDDVESKHAEAKLQEELTQARRRRKTEQKENEESYGHALIDLHGTVLEEEGPDLRERMMDERRSWFTEELGKGVFPEDLGEFYLAKNPPIEEAAAEEDAAANKKGGGKKDDKKGGGNKKGGKGGAVEEEEVEKLPPLTGPTTFTRSLKDCLDRYTAIWLERDESDNFQQKHDVELAKNVVRPNVEEEVRENVDKMLVMQLANLKAQLEAAAGGKKGKKKGKDKKKKGKKGKDKKGKKGKPLPGEKLCSGIDLQDMLSTLIECGIIKRPGDAAVSDLLGDFNYLGSAYQQQSEARDAWGNWVPQDPSMSQVRQAITEYIILPLGSPFLRVAAPYSRSVLLYGPKGCGKTLLAQAVANHTRALFIDLSPPTLQNLPKAFREGKSGPTKLMHMAFAVARSPNLGPSVIYMDNIDKVFVGKKKGAGGEAAKFRKDFVTYANSLKPEERVAVIGTSSEPFNIPDGEFKDIRAVFQRQLYMPFPDYASRIILWRAFLQRAFAREEMDIPEEIDISALALVSEGYSAGSLLAAVEKTLTERRFSTLKSRPISDRDFLTPLSSTACSFEEDNLKFQQFTAAISGLRDRRELVKSLTEGDGDGGKDAKKKKKK